jgi:DNA-binding response OmpR family regulator
MKAVAKASYGSNWVSERLKLTGHVSTEPDRIKKVLIVEDDAALAFLLKSTLEMQGYAVETCITHEEAQAALEKDQVDLLLMDPTIYGKTTGWALSTWVRQQDHLKHMAIICMSTLHDREEALSAGADLYLPKPFDLSSLFTWVDRFLKR